MFGSDVQNSPQLCVVSLVPKDVLATHYITNFKFLHS